MRHSPSPNGVLRNRYPPPHIYVSSSSFSVAQRRAEEQASTNIQSSIYAYFVCIQSSIYAYLCVNGVLRYAKVSKET
jgi:hypothetical protein